MGGAPGTLIRALRLALPLAMLAGLPGAPPGLAGLSQGPAPLSQAYRLDRTWRSLDGADLPPRAFSRPEGLGLDKDPFDDQLYLYVADTGNHRVQVFHSEGDFVLSLGGPATARAGGPDRLLEPADAAVQGSLVFVADRGHDRVALFTTDGAYVGQWAGLDDPRAIAVSPAGQIAVLEQGASRIAIFQADGRRLATFGGFGEGPGQLNQPRGLAYLPDGRLVVADSGNDRVVVLDGQGRQLDASPLPDRPLSVARDPNNGDLLTLLATGQIWRLADQPTLPPRLGAAARLPAPFAVDIVLGKDRVGSSQLFASIRDDVTPFHGLQQWSGSPLAVPADGGRWGEAALPLGLLEGPYRLAAGRDGAWVADRWPRVQHYDPAGVADRQFPAARLEDLHVREDGSLVTAAEAMLWRNDPVGGQELGAAAPILTRDYLWLTALSRGEAPNETLALELGGQALLRWDGSFRAPTALWTWSTTNTVRMALWDLAPAGAGRLWTVNRSAGSLEQRSLSDGTPLGAWTIPGRPVRVASDEAGAAYVLNARGWVVKLDPDATILAAFDARGPDPGAALASPSDLDVDASGTVLVSDAALGEVRGYRLDPSGAPGAMPDFEARCAPAGHKSADPTQLLLGQTTRVQLRIRGDCPKVDSPTDLTLVIDHSGSMTGPKMDAAKQAAEDFIAQMDLALDRVAVVRFNQDAVLSQPLTADGASAIDAVRALQAGGGTNIAAGVDAARSELTGPRRRLGAASVIILMTDGGSDVPAALRAADQAKLEGSRLFTIAFGADANVALLAQMASGPTDFYSAALAADLQRVYRTIAGRLRASVLFGSLTITDEVPANMAYVPGSAQPPASLQGQRLIWTLADLPLTGETVLTYRLRPLEAGRHPTNVFAVGEGIDGLGQPGRVDFPVPYVEVAQPSPTPGPSPTPTLSPTPGPSATPTPTPRPIYLPYLDRGACLKSVQRADVVLVVDSSDSMLDPTRAGRSKLQAAVEAALGFVDLLALESGDATAVVSFNGEAQIRLPLSRDRAAVRAALGALPQASGTRIDLGLRMARDALAGPGRQAANRPVVILLTDGRPSTGPGAVLAEATALRAAGVTLFAIGLGQDVDAALLGAITGVPARVLLAPDGEDLLTIYEAIARSLPCDPD